MKLEVLQILQIGGKTKMKNEEGVSLLEILVSVSIFAILGVVVAQSILLTLRGANRSQNLVRIRENINYAVAIIERQVRNANTVTTCDGIVTPPNPNPNTVSYLDSNNNPGSFGCVGLGSTDSYISSGSASIRLTSPDIKLVNCSISCSAATSASNPSVTVSVQATDARATGVENTSVYTTTTILLRNY